jgi:hypothetical protein
MDKWAPSRSELHDGRLHRPVSQNERMRLDASTLAVFRRLEEQRQLVVSMHEPDPGIRMLIERKEREERFLKDLVEPPALRELLAVHRKFDEQQRMFRDLLADPGIAAALSGVPSPALADFAKQTEVFRDQRRDEVAAEVVAHGAASVDALDSVESHPLDRLAEEREAILICLKRVGQVGVAGAYFGVGIPHVVLGLVLVFLVLGEVADEILR